jgi:predicted HAD superfamily phosphohydrolase YqeG
MIKPKKRHAPKRSVYIDVDGTLIVNGRINTMLVRSIKEMHSNGYYLVLWSAAGYQHTRSVAERAGIDNLFAAILTKPETVIDDLGHGWARYINVIKK